MLNDSNVFFIFRNYMIKSEYKLAPVADVQMEADYADKWSFLVALAVRCPPVAKAGIVIKSLLHSDVCKKTHF